MNTSAIMILVAWAIGILLVAANWYSSRTGTHIDGVAWLAIFGLPGIVGLVVAAIGTVLYMFLGHSPWVWGLAIASYAVSLSMVSWLTVLTAWDKIGSWFS